MTSGSLTSSPPRGESKYPTGSSPALHGALSEARSPVSCSATESTVGDRVLLPKSDPQGKQKSFESLDQKLQVGAMQPEQEGRGGDLVLQRFKDRDQEHQVGTEWAVLKGLETVINAQVIYELVNAGVEYAFLKEHRLRWVLVVWRNLSQGLYAAEPQLSTARRIVRQIAAVPHRSKLLQEIALRKAKLHRMFPQRLYTVSLTRQEALCTVQSSGAYVAEFEQPYLPLVTDLIRSRIEDLEIQEPLKEPYDPVFLDDDALGQERRKRSPEQLEGLEAAEPRRKVPRVD